MHENEINELRGLWDELNERILEKKNAEKAIKKLREKAIQILDSISVTGTNGQRVITTRISIGPPKAEDATCLPAKLPTEAEWRRSWIDWAKREKNAAIDKTFEGLSIEELQEQATQALHEWVGRNPLLPEGHFGIGKSALIEEYVQQREREQQAIEELAEEEVENARLDK